MQESSESSLDLTFPKRYLQKLEEYRKRQVEPLTRPRRLHKRRATPKVFSNNCKLAIPFANKVYCYVLKEMIDRSLCRTCPSFEREPLEYTLFRRE